MNNSNAYFREVYELQSRIAKAKEISYRKEFREELAEYLKEIDANIPRTAQEVEEELKKMELIAKDLAKAELRETIDAAMSKVFIQDAYVLTLDHVAQILGINSDFVEANILSHLDYVETPAKTSSFFYKLSKQNKLGNGETIEIWQSRYYKFKKLLISYDSFANLLVKNLKISTDTGTELSLATAKSFIHAQVLAIPFFKRHTLLSTSTKLLYRKRDIKELVLEHKFNKFVASSVQDIKRSHHNLTPDMLPETLTPLLRNAVNNPPGLRGLSELEAFKLIQRLTPTTLGIVVHRTETERFTRQHRHIKLSLKLDNATLNLYLFYYLLEKENVEHKELIKLFSEALNIQ